MTADGTNEGASWLSRSRACRLCIYTTRDGASSQLDFVHRGTRGTNGLALWIRRLDEELDGPGHVGSADICYEKSRVCRPLTIARISLFLFFGSNTLINPVKHPLHELLRVLNCLRYFFLLVRLELTVDSLQTPTMPPKRTSKLANSKAATQQSSGPPLPLKLRIRITRIQTKQRNFYARKELYLSRMNASMAEFLPVWKEKFGGKYIPGILDILLCQHHFEPGFTTDLSADNIDEQEAKAARSERWLFYARSDLAIVEQLTDAVISGNKRKYMEAIELIDKELDKETNMKFRKEEAIAEWEN
ncbi:hypothetical protein BJ508DRAFT_312040 [Ascobolus immersus RN42]|uniref:Uncharacterized protein n=1 Tax=Ascobolus immersus RN42 TaxID=1160509 RepID=A0A3N4HTP5_ASCIM|nr:hypothetical protein BJ508DRAFT_312040 [Ascobolus immersus RN42]